MKKKVIPDKQRHNFMKTKIFCHATSPLPSPTEVWQIIVTTGLACFIFLIHDNL